jgi:hypothetical protein
LNIALLGKKSSRKNIYPYRQFAALGSAEYSRINRRSPASLSPSVHFCPFKSLQTFLKLPEGSFKCAS